MSATFWGDGRATRYATDNVLRTTRSGVATASAVPLPVRRALHAFFATAVALVLALGTASPASAIDLSAVKGGPGKNTTISYAAVGDSYAAGQGAGSYLNTTCYVSTKGYPAVLDSDRRIQLTARPACSGASTLEVISGQVPQVPATTARVTLTAGGNDVGFANTMQNCFVIVNNTACQTAIASANTMISNGTVSSRIAATVQAIKTRAPSATVIVTGYPRLFAPTVTRAYAQQVNTSATAMNVAIKAGAQSAGAVFVDVEGVFATHGIGSASPWINDWSWLNTSAGFHPNASGYAAYAAQVTLAM